MSVSSANRLTSETLSLVLKCLPLHDLTLASLVSKSWRAVAFPHLYHTVCVTLARHLEDLAERIASDSDGPFSLRTHIRGLIFDQHYGKIMSDTGEPVTEDDLGHLATLLSELTRLEHFGWECSYAPRNAEVLETLQANSSIKSIYWSLGEDEENMLDESFDDYVKLLEFKNLFHFGLTIRQIPHDFDEISTEPLANLLRACPDLKSLNLNLQDWDDIAGSWSPDALLDALDSQTFPSLHTFRAHGKAGANWQTFFTAPDESPLRTFLSRHQKIHTLGLGWISEWAYHQDIDPNDMATLLPSLKHLEAPAFFCAPVLASSLASQLESVTVMDDIYDGTGPNLGTIAERVAHLPKLRKFYLESRRDIEIPAEPLKKILSAAPALVEFKILIALDQPEQFLETLKLAPNLRVLGTYRKVLDPLQEQLGVSKMEDCIVPLAQNCPSLERINYLADGDEDPCWEIQRGADGQVTYTASVIH